MWYLIVSITDLCTLTYFVPIKQNIRLVYLCVYVTQRLETETRLKVSSEIKKKKKDLLVDKEISFHYDTFALLALFGNLTRDIVFHYLLF